MISLGGGSTWLAGEVSSNDPKTKLLKVTFTVTNSAHDTTSFKIGDVRLEVGTEQWDDFLAVGYNTQLCSMGDDDRKKVKQIVVSIPAGGRKTLSYVFPIASSHPGQGQLTVGASPQVTFEIRG